MHSEMAIISYSYSVHIVKETQDWRDRMCKIMKSLGTIVESRGAIDIFSFHIPFLSFVFFIDMVVIYNDYLYCGCSDTFELFLCSLPY